METLRQTAHLEDWSIQELGLTGDAVLFGTVSGHPLLEDGKVVRTSTILEISDRWARTQNTDYTLGEPRKISEQ